MDVSVFAHPQAVALHGGTLDLRGSPDEVRADLSANPQTEPANTPHGTPRLAVRGDDLAVTWTTPAFEARATSVSFARGIEGSSLRATAGEARIRLGALQVDARDASIETAADQVRGVHASDVEAAIALGPAGPLPDSAPVGPAVAPGGATTAPPTAPDADGGDSLQLPDSRRWRARIGVLAGGLARKWPLDASLAIDALRWRLEGGESRTPLTVGPGPLTLRRTSGRFEGQYATDGRGDQTAVVVKFELPTDDGDATFAVRGGPIALSLLGVHEGAFGLVDVDKTTVAGRATLRLAGDGSTLTFDVDANARALALRQARLARETLHGIDVQVVARGALDHAQTLRVDDFAATFGALRLAGSGTLDQLPDRTKGAFRFELPSTPCQSLVESMPTALLPALDGVAWRGTLGARGGFSFDTTALDALDLSYEVQDGCRAVDVPPELAHGRFGQPFQHTVILPDGSTTEQTTGPGTDNWTRLDEISPYMQIAVLTTEDGAFYHHHGFNHAAIKASLIANLKARRFVRGASTISMQLAKNLFLSREKTLSRKVEEVVLTDYLEQAFTKEDIMELYLNVVEFGPAVYGITAASEYYFGRTPAELDLAESLFLSSLLPSPRRYGAMRDGDHPPDSWMRGLHNLMHIARRRGLLRQSELDEGLQETVDFWHGGVRPPPRPPVPPRTSFDAVDDDQDTQDTTVDGP